MNQRYAVSAFRIEGVPRWSDETIGSGPIVFSGVRAHVAVQELLADRGEERAVGIGRRRVVSAGRDLRDDGLHARVDRADDDDLGGAHAVAPERHPLAIDVGASSRGSVIASR